MNKEKLKIIHICSTDSGGAFEIANSLVKAQNEADLDSKLLVFTGKNSNFKISGLKIVDDFIKFILHAFEKFIFLFYEKEKKYRFVYSLGFPNIQFYFLEKKIKNVDIIHLHWINKGFVDLKDLRKIKKPIIWTNHDIWAATGGCHLTFNCENYKFGCGNCPMLKYSNENDLSKKLFNIKKDIFSQLKIQFITPSHWLKNQMNSSEILKNVSIEVIHNGVDTEVFNYAESQNLDDILRVGFVAQNLNDSNKALWRLVEALNNIKNKKVELHLVGNKKSEFDFEMNFNHQFIGTINSKKEIARFYNKIDVLVSTSSIETFPTILMEAACCGVKCMGFDVGGVSEILLKCDGVIINPYDTNILCEEIDKIEKFKIDRRYISGKSISCFSLDTTVNKYNDYYKLLIKT